jgi:hypothetical protein
LAQKRKSTLDLGGLLPKNTYICAEAAISVRRSHDPVNKQRNEDSGPGGMYHNPESGCEVPGALANDG